MKPVTFKNRVNGERVICENTRQIEVIDGVEYLVVHRYGNDRSFYMRKDVLERVRENLANNR